MRVSGSDSYTSLFLFSRSRRQYMVRAEADGTAVFLIQGGSGGVKV